MKDQKVLLTEIGVENESPKLREVVDTLEKKRASDISTSAIDHTAVIPNPYPFWGIDANGQPTILFQAGWYLSAEEHAHKISLLTDGYTVYELDGVTIKKKWTGAEVGTMNSQQNAGLKAAGWMVDVQPAKQKEVKVYDLDPEDK